MSAGKASGVKTFRFDSTNDEERGNASSSVAVVIFFPTGALEFCLIFFLRTTGTELSLPVSPEFSSLPVADCPKSAETCGILHFKNTD
jgi:hypothetical protein